MTITFGLNGGATSFSGDPMTRLLDVLRSRPDTMGTKEGCGEGECGSCSVLLDAEVVCACLVPIFQVAGRAVTTIEALAADGTLAPVQTAFVEQGGVQCGACTPGILMAAHALLDRNPDPDRAAIREALAGNLCRCTGYERIFRAVLAARGVAAE